MMMPLWSLLVLALVVSPEPSPEYLAAFQRAEQDNSWVYDNYRAHTEEALVRLRAALAGLHAFEEELSGDEYGRKLVINLRKSLARTLLARGKKGDAAEARRVIEELVVVSAIESTDLFFGEELEAMMTAQTLAMDAKGKGTLEVVCHQPCLVTINRRPMAGPEQRLYLGSYVVEIRAAEGTEPAPVRETVKLTARDEFRTLEFGSPPEAEVEVGPAVEVEVEPEPEPEPEPAQPEPEPEPEPAPEPAKRILPRWLEVGGLVAGVGLAAGGGGMLSTDGKCERLSDDVTTCPQVWESTPGSVAMLVIGGGVAIASAVLLGIDERRGRRAQERRVAVSPGGVVVRF